MIMGYAIIAVPTGIVTVELGKEKNRQQIKECPSCNAMGHDTDATHCKYCGQNLEEA